MSKVLSRVLVTGANGRLGTALMKSDLAEAWCLLPITRERLSRNSWSLTDVDDVKEIFHEFNPDIVINLAANTNVDECEERPIEAFHGNAKIVDCVSQAIRQASKDIFLIQISTDQVYDGIGVSSEKDVLPRNYYAYSKYIGDLHALAAGGVVLRTNFFGKSLVAGKLGFTDWIYKSLKNGETINAFNDVKFSPLSINTLINYINIVMKLQPKGAFNLGSNEGMSKAAFIELFAKHTKLDCSKIRSIPIGESVQVKAYRPRDMRMNVQLFESFIKCRLPTLEQEIIKVSEDYNE